MKITDKQIEIFKNNNCNMELIFEYINNLDEKLITQQFIDQVMPPTTRFGSDGKNHSMILRIKIFKELQAITDYKIRTYFDEEDLKDDSETIDELDIKENTLF